uniref:Multiple inositol polyphosphate phosphatase 1 n=1 Tax=Guillardia theta TaxID=55529 RepID=A0A7S4URH5_GUITH|mmetsp:Transcript_52530/g.163026  ORF Transcript_52530/g.163026 Transcript_52530/m.163026 type:complete len:544 (+) Transcript_52530:134-1765(+)
MKARGSRADFFIILVLFFCTVCNSLQDKLSEHLGSKGPYIAPEGWTRPEVPSTCTPTMITGVFRHGSRNPSAKDIKKFEQLEDLLRRLSREINTTNDKLRWAQTWKNPFKEEDASMLVSLGVEEHLELGRRWQARFPHLLSDSYHPRHHVFRSSCHERSARSAHAFAGGAFDVSGPGVSGRYNPVHVITPSCESRDTTLRFFDSCPRYKKEKRKATQVQEQFLESKEVQDVVARVGSKLGLKETSKELKAKHVAAMFTLCAFEAGQMKESSRFCSLLDEDDMSTMEYWDDLKHFYKKSYGLAMNAGMACPLLLHLVHVMKSRPPHKTAELLFAHGETMLPLVTLLGLFQDPFQLNASTPLHLRRTRKFRSGRIIPMAANIVFVLHSCRQDSSSPQDLRVLVMVNERPVKLAACSEEEGWLCPLDSLIRIISDRQDTPRKLLNDLLQSEGSKGDSGKGKGVLEHICGFRQLCALSGKEGDSSSSSCSPEEEEEGEQTLNEGMEDEKLQEADTSETRLASLIFIFFLLFSSFSLLAFTAWFLSRL